MVAIARALSTLDSHRTATAIVMEIHLKNISAQEQPTTCLHAQIQPARIAKPKKVFL
jgi:hypothetical protein